MVKHNQRQRILLSLNGYAAAKEGAIGHDLYSSSLVLKVPHLLPSLEAGPTSHCTRRQKRVTLVNLLGACPPTVAPSGEGECMYIDRVALI
jgi:hypothetical protein